MTVATKTSSLITLSHFCAHIKNCLNNALAKTAVPYNRTNLQAALQLYNQGFISGIQRGSTFGPDQVETEVTHENISSRRIWIDLKYRQNQSVINQMKMVSVPSKKVELSAEDVRNLAAGVKVRRVDPIQPAECLFIENEGQLYELKDAAKKGLGGKALFRIR
ncbi:hypothetical protein PVL30_000713 [Lodderomyces elongisporus]|uniref:Uncharacterized protein n=1 Tax=Lodderomyces elongisporus (strain ATCC 11503 / CBS 2605 / JCM 1781 / NBRC 1676 / NRRL YB-4239) TaxID=379508 RepID=A5DTQ5_LODEL|nr:uncharacterized protein PVL30_000713 [Lodderomyces elongisporus]EDK42563.1 conserved hypothetical protein [Lodderomyces elongisporus NRRL YB-4239]WLF77005.1 hypothetical protein PVL30_000713 [Lodderomyces elongisporus]